MLEYQLDMKLFLRKRAKSIQRSTIISLLSVSRLISPFLRFSHEFSFLFGSERIKRGHESLEERWFSFYPQL